MEPQEFTVDPQQLRAEAEREKPRRGLDEYRETIRVLKEDKEFSFREIAAWFKQRGIDIDHNAAWRTYSRIRPTAMRDSSSERSERLEQRRASEGAMPWLEGS